jgi:hypothetical protein
MPIKSRTVRVCIDHDEWYTHFFSEATDSSFTVREVPTKLWKEHEKAQKAWDDAREKLLVYFDKGKS